MVADIPTTWSNSLPSSATGLSPFERSLGYQPPLFPNQELEVGVPSAQGFVRCCRRTWNKARSSLLKTAARCQRQADRLRTPAPRYWASPAGWLNATLGHFNSPM
ncbi:hypothetical protein DPEC_G00059290 [Dallia pectoralis]|uniref:Uncharacterized protein n=1 Tax=Dallia pectoralis TaxID=75939 RepID=A0ACC2H7A4_DALPE|nr:hypothetical protein DPEC_G00059290 [Dallia pectoralis]